MTAYRKCNLVNVAYFWQSSAQAPTNAMQATSQTISNSVELAAALISSAELASLIGLFLWKTPPLPSGFVWFLKPIAILLIGSIIYLPFLFFFFLFSLFFSDPYEVHFSWEMLVGAQS